MNGFLSELSMHEELEPLEHSQLLRECLGCHLRRCSHRHISNHARLRAFSTVQGYRGSADTVRDVRGFAVKFYTEEGNWDIVGNDIPVFFIQDAFKFPDVIHSGSEFQEPTFELDSADIFRTRAG